MALRDDFRKLDRLLPADAVLFAPYIRLPSVYAPRPVVFDAADLPAGRPSFLMSVSGPGDTNGVAVGAEVYANPKARLVLFRRWWVPPVDGDLRVYPLLSPAALR